MLSHESPRNGDASGGVLFLRTLLKNEKGWYGYDGSTLKEIPINDNLAIHHLNFLFTRHFGKVPLAFVFFT